MSMAKKMISRLSVLAVLIVFLAACSKQTEYTNVIPADATAVASIDLKSLANKAGMNDKENFSDLILQKGESKNNRIVLHFPCHFLHFGKILFVF